MSRVQRKRITRRDAEKALAGESMGVPVVDELLSAARRPAAQAGVPGEAPALASFRVAQAQPAAPVARRGKLVGARAAILAALSTKLAAGAVAAVAAGGVVLAASTGVLPGTSTTTHANAPHPSSSATPNPHLRGLCVAFRAEVGKSPGAALSNPAFSALAKAAGHQTIADYCAQLLATAPASARATAHPTGKPTSLPTHVPSHAANHATAHPTGPPTAHPTGKPSSLPSQVPPRASAHPTGPPSPHPTAPAQPSATHP